METSVVVGLAAVAVVAGIVLLLAFSLVNAFTPEFNMVLVAIVAIVAVLAIVVMALACKNRD